MAELMIVVSALAILAAILVPKYGSLIRGAREAGTLGNLGSLRSALTLYYSENAGLWPSGDPAGFLVPRFLPEVPECWTRSHGASWNVEPFDTALTDRDGWGYWTASGPIAPGRSRLFVTCTHEDTKGTVWSRR